MRTVVPRGPTGTSVGRLPAGTDEAAAIAALALFAIALGDIARLAAGRGPAT